MPICGGIILARKIVITSGKGGVGKTTFTAELGIHLALKSKKVLMIDADMGLNNLDVVLGLESKVIFDLFDLLQGRCSVEQTFVKDLTLNNLYILPSSHSITDIEVSATIFKNIIDLIDKDFDYILIDSPAGIEKGFYRSIYVADEAIVVATPTVSAIRDADKVISILQSYEFNNVNLVVNRVRSDMIKKGLMLSARQISKVLRRPLLGVIPEDDCISIYSQLGRLNLNDSLSNIAFEIVANNIDNGQNRIFEPENYSKSLIFKLKRLVKNI